VQVLPEHVFEAHREHPGRVDVLDVEPLVFGAETEAAEAESQVLATVRIRAESAELTGSRRLHRLTDASGERRARFDQWLAML
jgi:hypothetical protein